MPSNYSENTPVNKLQGIVDCKRLSSKVVCICPQELTAQSTAAQYQVLLIVDVYAHTILLASHDTMTRTRRRKKKEERKEDDRDTLALLQAP